MGRDRKSSSQIALQMATVIRGCYTKNECPCNRRQVTEPNLYIRGIKGVWTYGFSKTISPVKPISTY